MLSVSAHCFSFALKYHFWACYNNYLKYSCQIFQLFYLHRRGDKKVCLSSWFNTPCPPTLRGHSGPAHTRWVSSQHTAYSTQHPAHSTQHTAHTAHAVRAVTVTPAAELVWRTRISLRTRPIVVQHFATPDTLRDTELCDEYIHFMLLASLWRSKTLRAFFLRLCNAKAKLAVGFLLCSATLSFLPTFWLWNYGRWK